jgi:SPP1 gp7 family putative phage head morphogenesis protein
MSFLKSLARLFTKQEEKGLADIVYGWRWGEPKPLDQKQLLDLVEGNDYLRAAIEATVNAALVNGWIIIGDNEAEKNKVEGWISENENDFYLFLRNLLYTARIFGEAYIEVYAEPVFKVLDTWSVQVIRNEYGKITGYVQRIAGREVRFEPDEVVRIVLHPLGTRAYGSPITATLRRTLEGQMYAELFIRDAFMRKGVLSKAFVMKSGGEEDFKRLMEVINSSSPGSSLIIKGDIEIQDLGHPFRELEILELLREYRQKIISVSGVPPILLGLEGGTNLETSRNQINSFVMMVKSLQNIISAGVTEAIRRRLGVKSVKFILQAWTNPEQETRLHVMRVQAGIETINEARKALGLEELDHPIANIPIPFLQIAARGGFTELDIETAIGQLLAQSGQTMPEKSLVKQADYDEYDQEILKNEKRLKRELRSFFRKIVDDDSPNYRAKWEPQVKDVLRRYLLYSALQGIFYVDSLSTAPPNISLAERAVNKILPAFLDDFFMVVADKKAGLVKPSKPARNYQTLFKADYDEEEEGEVTEEDLYPAQRLDYEGRIDAIAQVSVWGIFNMLIAWSARDAGFQKVVWVTRMDEKTCSECASLDGMEWSVGELDSAGFMSPPIHPNCRCRLIVA